MTYILELPCQVVLPIQLQRLLLLSQIHLAATIVDVDRTNCLDALLKELLLPVLPIVVLEQAVAQHCSPFA